MHLLELGCKYQEFSNIRGFGQVSGICLRLCINCIIALMNLPTSHQFRDETEIICFLRSENCGCCCIDVSPMLLLCSSYAVKAFGIEATGDRLITDGQGAG